ncbi:MAG: glycosyltransferase [Methylobacterium frigidaeris]
MDDQRRIWLVGLGTHGDILPVIALGAALRQRGHDARVAVPAPFLALASRAGLPCHPIGSQGDFDRVMADRSLWRPIRGARALFTAAVEAAGPTYRWLEENGRPGHDLVVASSLAFGARIAQDRLGFSLATLHLMPMLVESRLAPPRLPGLPLPGWLPARLRHGMGRGADRFVIGPAALPALNALRATLGLGPVRRLRHWWHSPECVLLAVPEWYAAPQSDWPAQLTQTGFPLADTYGDAEDLSPELRAFLRDGAPPVAFMYGSAMLRADRFFATAVDLCRRSGRRGVLLTAHGGQIPAGLPPGILHAAYAPLSRLLPACAALVHHGGVGTVAQALAAGCPQLIVPVAFDHADEARRVSRLGVGTSLSRRRFTARRGHRALEGMLASGPVQAACREVRARVAGGRGIPALCDAIDAMLARQA